MKLVYRKNNFNLTKNISFKLFKMIANLIELNRSLSSNFWWPRSSNHVKFTEECVMSMKKCCGLQIRLVEQQLKQRVIGECYCISRKRKSYKGSTSRSRLVKCLVRNEKLSSPSELSSANMFRLDKSIFGVW